MLKVAILDDYQNVAQDFVDLKKLSGKYEIEIFKNKIFFFDNRFIVLSKFNGILIPNTNHSNFFNYFISYFTS